MKSKLTILIGLMTLVILGSTGCATKKYVRQQVQTLDPTIKAIQDKATENAERIDAVDKRAQTGIANAAAASAAAATADQKAVTAQQSAQTAQTAAQAAQQTATTANNGVQQANNRINTVESRVASINDAPMPESERKYFWLHGRRPDDHPALSALGL